MNNQEPWSVYRFFMWFSLALLLIVLVWEKAATPEMKAYAKAMGDEWVKNARRVDNLQATPWLENIGVLHKGTMQSARDKAKEKEYAQRNHR